MRLVRLASETDLSGWRVAARALDREGVAPEEVVWTVEGRPDADLFAAEAPPEAAAPSGPVPRAFLELTERMLLHRDPERFALAYRLLRRLREDPDLMEVPTDPDLTRGLGMGKQVRRDMHKMTAFVRFRSVEAEDGEAFVSWFEPDHHIVEAAAPFFVRRFANMRWSILTPEASAHWDGEALAIGPGSTRAEAPPEDAMEDAWRTYYASIFNPARLKVRAMTAEMPRKYWRNLPEARLIDPLIREARGRTQAMVAAAPTAPRASSTWVREEIVTEVEPQTLEALAKAEAACERCPLHRDATQVVPGEGDPEADLMFVGEQPGDQEDLAGKPFVGPAGKVFSTALERLQMDRRRVFVTNAVKHFKFEPRGKKRIHSRPNAGEIDACRWWLDIERTLVKPKLIVAMGASAVRGVTGKTQPVKAFRARVTALEGGGHMMGTVHPSYLLRLRSEEEKRVEWRAFLDDLTVARDWLRENGGAI